MSQKKFDEKLLEKIKAGHLAPKPRWRFLVKNYLVWGLGALALLVGGLAFSVIIYMFSFNDWDIYSQMSNSLFEFVILTLPYFWIVILVLFILAVNYNLRHTKTGYRYPVAGIVAGTIVISMALGVLFFGVGMGQAIDDALAENIPLYENIINQRVQFWNAAQTGRIAGVVNAITSEDSFTMITPDNREWLISAGSASLPSEFEVVSGMPLKLLGQKTATSTFSASEILPPGPGRGFFERPKHDLPEMFEMMEDMHDSGMQIRIRFRPHPDAPAVNQFFMNYPQVKTGFEEILLDNKDQYRNLIKNDPNFLSVLNALNISPDVISQLQGE